MYFKESTEDLGRLIAAGDISQSTLEDIRSTPCIPLTTMLLALNQTRIDFLSLDVEGLELSVLQTLRWDLIDIRTIAVEYAHGSKTELKQYIESHGFRLIRDIQVSNIQDSLYVEDLIFVK